jgi:hypothetical protein
MADTNNVFISWSGPRSNHVAKSLRKWLRSVIHSARPWMSEKDIKSGSVSVNSIRTALASVKAGIVCLTPESLKEPWLNFEAGGLLRTPEAETRVCTYLLAGLEPGQLEYPLAMFQARIADREQTLALVQNINRYLDENPLTEAEMKEAFEKWWPDLEKELNALPVPSSAPPLVAPPIIWLPKFWNSRAQSFPQSERLANRLSAVAARNSWPTQWPRRAGYPVSHSNLSRSVSTRRNPPRNPSRRASQAASAPPLAKP